MSDARFELTRQQWPLVRSHIRGNQAQNISLLFWIGSSNRRKREAWQVKRGCLGGTSDIWMSLFLDDPEGVIGDTFPTASGFCAAEIQHIVAILEKIGGNAHC